MKVIQLKTQLPREEVEARAGRFMTPDDYDIVVGGVNGETCTVLKPDGNPLVIYVKDVLPRSLCAEAFSIFKQVDVDNGGTNRGMAAGIIDDVNDSRIDPVDTIHGDVKLTGRGTRFYPMKEDGTVSRTARAASVPTAIIGFFDRYPRIPYCRQTAFTMDHPDLWQKALPYIQKVNEIFKEYAPEHHAKQQEFVKAIHPDFIIPGTAFSTLTINRDWRTALHQDCGDFRSGLGVMTVLQGGTYSGCELVFPRYRCAVDMRTGGVALADVHEFHGNAPLEGVPGQFVRISAVFYVREKMSECGSKEFELERAKQVSEQVATRHATESRKFW